MAWFGKKCKSCRARINKGDETAELRLDTSEGFHNIEICLACADFFEKSADVLQKGRSDD